MVRAALLAAVLILAACRRETPVKEAAMPATTTAPPYIVRVIPATDTSESAATVQQPTHRAVAMNTKSAIQSLASIERASEDLPNVRLTFQFIDPAEYGTPEHAAFHARNNMPKPDATRPYDWSEHGFDARFAVQVDPRNEATPPKYRGQPVRIGLVSSRTWSVVVPKSVANRKLVPLLEYTQAGRLINIPPYRGICECDKQPTWTVVSREPTADKVGVDR